jgi:signal transduction histidine kinase
MMQRQIFLHIARPWFLRLWLLWLACIVLVGLVLLIMQWRTRYLKRQNRLLAQKVNERTAELSATLEELRASEQKVNRQMQIQSAIIGVISHDIRSPLRHLTIGIGKLYQQASTEYPQIPFVDMIKSFHQSAEGIFQLTEDLLSFVKVTRREGDVVFENVSIATILEAKRNLFSDIAMENQTAIIIEAQDNLTAYTSNQMLEIIIHNLLDNAVKSTFRDTITLSAERSGDKICITVSDTGDGMPQESADWLSDPTLSEAGMISGSGFGLIVVKEIASILGISIKAETAETGTNVELSII